MGLANLLHENRAYLDPISARTPNKFPNNSKLLHADSDTRYTDSDLQKFFFLVE